MQHNESYSYCDHDEKAARSSSDYSSHCSSVICHFWDPRFRPYRYVLCIFASIIEASTIYCLEFPVGIQSPLIQVMKIDNEQYNFFFSSYTWCDIVTSVVGSVVVNRYLGIRLGVIIFTTWMLFGQVVVSIGAFVESFITMVLGRVILGSASGTLISVTSSFMIKWFRGKEVTFIVSVSRCFARAAATLALIAPLIIYNGFDFFATKHNQLGITLMTASLLCLLCVGFSIIVAIMDRHAESKIGKDSAADLSEFHIMDILEYPLSFWITILVIGLYYAVAFTSTANAQTYFVNKYRFSVLFASLANSLSSSFVIFGSPFLALFIDFSGYNLIYALIATVIYILSYSMYIVANVNDSFVPWMGALLLSLSYSFFGTSMWVAIGLIVSNQQVPTAYGLAMSFFSITLTVIGGLSGLILDYCGYLLLYLFFIVVLVVILGFILYLLISELFGDKVLNVPGSVRKLKQHE